MTRRAIVTKAMIERTIRAAQAAGLTVIGVRVQGSMVEVLTGEDKATKAARLAKGYNVRL